MALVSSYELKNINSNKIMFTDGKYLSLNIKNKQKKTQNVFIGMDHLF